MNEGWTLWVRVFLSRPKCVKATGKYNTTRNFTQKFSSYCSVDIYTSFLWSSWGCIYSVLLEHLEKDKWSNPNPWYRLLSSTIYQSMIFLVVQRGRQSYEWGVDRIDRSLRRSKGGGGGVGETECRHILPHPFLSPIGTPLTSQTPHLTIWQ